MVDGDAETTPLVVDIIIVVIVIVFNIIFNIILVVLVFIVIVINVVFSVGCGILTGVARKVSVTAFIAAVGREFGGATTLHGRAGEREAGGDKDVLHATKTNRKYHFRTTVQV